MTSLMFGVQCGYESQKLVLCERIVNEYNDDLAKGSKLLCFVQI